MPTDRKPPGHDRPHVRRRRYASAPAKGELVLITQGSSARLTPETKNLPIDAVIIGIVDTVHVDQTMRVRSRRIDQT